MSDISELPLKPAPETFTDEPNDVADVNIHDLVIDIQAHTKDINKLHIFQAIAVFLYTLKDVIKLQESPELFTKFRDQTLIKHSSLLRHESSTKSSSTNSSSTVRSSTPTPPNSPPTKLMKLPDTTTLKETTPDSLGDGKESSKESSKEPISSTNDAATPPSDFLDLKQLIDTTDLQKSYEMNFEDVTSEISYYQDPKVKSQNEHVLKGFNLLQPPELSIEQFLDRIKTYSSSISASCYVHAAFMIFKLCVFDQAVKLDLCNVYRLILASLRCSTKKLEDIFQRQKTFATVGGVSPNDLLKMEVGFLFLCNFKLVVNQNCLNNYLEDFASLRTFVRDNIDDTTNSNDL